MHRLARQVRFSVNPLLTIREREDDSVLAGSLDEGLSIFFELRVEVTGGVNDATGFIVNVTEIDEKVRKYVVPNLTEQISRWFRQDRYTGFSEITGLLRLAWGHLSDKFERAKLDRLELLLSPFRKLAVDSEGCKMVYYSEKFEFAATHKLWNNAFSLERNFEVFGKCANPTGHGHNYSVEVTVRLPGSGEGFRIGNFAKIVEGALIKQVDHKNLNADVAYFAEVIPTVENISAFAWGELAGKFEAAELHCVTVWETDRTSCSYYG